VTVRKPPRAPSGLGARGRRLWVDTVTVFDLRGDELGLLTELCRTLDALDTLETALQGAPLLTEGSQGQARANPLLAEIRGHRLAAVQLFRSLGLSDVADVDDAGSTLPTPRQARARRAAQARWGHGSP
jgi:hypothetical protein